MAPSVWADPGMGFVLGTPTTQGYVVQERRDDRLCATILQVQWEDRCSMTYQLMDEVRASCHGNLAREEALRKMIDEHEAQHHRALAHTYGRGSCIACDIREAKVWMVRQTRSRPDTIVVPEGLLEASRRAYNTHSSAGVDPTTVQAGAVPERPMRRYCPREG